MAMVAIWMKKSRTEWAACGAGWTSIMRGLTNWILKLLWDRLGDVDKIHVRRRLARECVRSLVRDAIEDESRG